MPRENITEALVQMKSLGFSPKCVIDVGAAMGGAGLVGLFPESSHLLVEPLSENKDVLCKIRDARENIYVEMAAAYKEDGEIVINVHSDLHGSSLYLENEDSDVNGHPRRVKAVRLDSLINKYNLSGPYLVKVDVQGAELDVLEGAPEVLEDAECVILEVSFFEFFENGPLFHEVVAYMASKGFYTYDIVGRLYRLLDDAMSQVDVVFVAKNSPLRKYQFYATSEQRKRQNEQMLRRIRQDMESLK